MATWAIRAAVLAGVLLVLPRWCPSPTRGLWPAASSADVYCFRSRFGHPLMPLSGRTLLPGRVRVALVSCAWLWLANLVLPRRVQFGDVRLVSRRRNVPQLQITALALRQ